jgi:hypothetical protein
MNNLVSAMEKLGFSTKEVYPTEKAKINCAFCKTCIQGHVAVFDCTHETCTMCLDKLADGYKLDCVDILFECPFCSKKVKNIEYK